MRRKDSALELEAKKIRKKGEREEVERPYMTEILFHRTCLREKERGERGLTCLIEKERLRDRREKRKKKR